MGQVRALTQMDTFYQGRLPFTVVDLPNQVIYTKFQAAKQTKLSLTPELPGVQDH